MPCSCWWRLKIDQADECYWWTAHFLWPVKIFQWIPHCWQSSAPWLSQLVAGFTEVNWCFRISVSVMWNKFHVTELPWDSVFSIWVAKSFAALLLKFPWLFLFAQMSSFDLKAKGKIVLDICACFCHQVGLRPDVFPLLRLVKCSIPRFCFPLSSSEVVQALLPVQPQFLSCEPTELPVPLGWNSRVLAKSRALSCISATKVEGVLHPLSTTLWDNMMDS